MSEAPDHSTAPEEGVSEAPVHSGARRRQVAYWRLLAAVFGYEQETANIERMTRELAQEAQLPELVLDPGIAVDTLLQRYPELEGDFQDLEARARTAEGATKETVEEDGGEKRVRRALLYSKLLLSVFGPHTQTPIITAAQYAAWLRDVSYLERACGYAPGQLRGSGSGGRGVQVDDEQLRTALMGLEQDLVKRMALREILNDDRLAHNLRPSMPLVEQLLRDKANLSGKALHHARRLIRQYVEELTEILRLQVQQAPAGPIDDSVPPRRVFRNLDLKRTVWKNLPNWDPHTQRLYVDRLYYKKTARLKRPSRMIVLVDQSGSMVDAMVQCTILASIFAGVPHVDVQLLAFDTRILDLTPWVHDPFEVLLRTELGGGTDIFQALEEGARRIREPRHTAFVLISDFYEGGSNQVLLDAIKRLKESGVHFFPVGALTSSGAYSVNAWFRTRLKELGTPILSGSPQKLIMELKKVLR